ncbi:hypothetical protein Ddye_004831 [Dipteronia dyeriana]|uniref:Uncharacterized protein n=1 Tax=Dipteronia dyeriana TaxID=168575 RepID=A0AAD9XFX2_9ROSI|nr:hypothetical protein Ddye_004831 [Dipteronia dyeriana]
MVGGARLQSPGARTVQPRVLGFGTDSEHGWSPVSPEAVSIGVDLRQGTSWLEGDGDVVGGVEADRVAFVGDGLLSGPENRTRAGTDPSQKARVELELELGRSSERCVTGHQISS